MEYKKSCFTIREIDLSFPRKGPILPVLLKAVLELNHEEDTHLYFRGEPRKYTYLIPSLYREGNERLVYEGTEKYYRYLISELGRDDYSESTSLVRLMAEFRHYEAATRILDISKNLLTAIFFAVEYDEANEKEPGYVYLFFTKKIYQEEKFDTGHTIAIKTALNLMSQDEINCFLRECSYLENLYDRCISTDKIDEDMRNLYRDYNLYRKTTNELRPYFDGLIAEKGITFDEEEHNKYEFVFSSIERFMELLNQRARVREVLVFPLQINRDLRTPQLFIPSMNTDRIKRQRGAFIFPSYIDTSDFDKENLVKDIDDIRLEIQESIFRFLYPGEKGNTIRIPYKYKARLREELSLLGIDGGFLYSDIKHHSASLLSEMNFYTK